MPIDYSKSKIYCIRNWIDNDNIVYVGSTTRPISERMAGHRKTIKEKPDIKIYALMASVGVEHFHVELLCNFPCTNREELLAEEGRHIRLHNTVENGANTNVAGRSQKVHYEENRARILEEKKQYQRDNAETLRQKDREWYAANKEKAAAQNKAYRLRHAEQLKAYEAARTAESSAKNKAYRLRNAERLKVYAAAHATEISTKGKAYYEAHREEILARHAAYRLKKANALAVAS